MLDIGPVVAGQPLRDTAPLLQLQGAGLGAPTATPAGHSLLVPTQHGWEE